MRSTKRKRSSLGRSAFAVAALALAFVMTSSPGARADTIPLDEVAREIERTASSYLEQGAYRIVFTQENYWSLADSSFVTAAVLTARPPHALSIRYDDGGRIVASAGTLKVYIPQTQQFFVSPVDTESMTVDPASILSTYHLHPQEPVISCDDSTLAVRLVPENRFMDPARVDVTIDRLRHLVSAISAHAASGDRSTYRIERTDFGSVVLDDEFRLAPPPGASVQSGSPYDHGDLGS